MRIRLLGIAGMLLCGYGAASAEGYQNAVAALYENNDEESFESNVYKIAYAHYFEILNTDIGPLAYAAFVNRPTAVMLSLKKQNSEYEFLDIKANGREYSIASYYIRGDYGVFADALVFNEDIHISPTLTWNQKVKKYSIGAIYYPEKYTEIKISHVIGDIAASTIFIGDGADISGTSFEVRKLVFMDDYKYLAVSIGYNIFNTDYSFFKVQEKFLNIDLDYFFNRYTDVSIGYAIKNSDNSDYSDDAYGYRVSYRRFIADSTSITIGYIKDNRKEMDDKTSYELGISKRF